MSEFSDALSTAWDTSVRVFGDVIAIGGTDYDCVVHAMQYSTEVQGGRPGRVAVLSGTAVMKATDWTLASGRKGIVIAVGNADGRVLNDPNVGYTSDTVTLQLGPLT